MTRRAASAVIVRATTWDHAGEVRTLHYGPFLPHAGSATTSFMDALRDELQESGRYKDWDVSAETLFIGDGESDCTVMATR